MLAVDIDGDGLDETLLRSVGKRDRAPSRRQRSAGVLRPRRRGRERVRTARRARQRGRHLHRRAHDRHDPRAVPPAHGRQPRRLLLPGPGRDPAPARDRRQHREHRVERGPPGRAVLGRVLHDQGRRRAAHPVAGGRVPEARGCGSTRSRRRVRTRTSARRRPSRPTSTSTSSPGWRASGGWRSPRRSPPCSRSSPPTKRAPSPGAIYTLDNGLTAS